MSSSFRAAPVLEASLEVHAFPYPEVTEGMQPDSGKVPSLFEQAERIETQERDAVQRIGAAREAGRKEGEVSAQASLEAHLGEVRGSVAAALQDFALQRARYFLQVETEVVRLALSIARKVLRREAQIDPLLLAGMVRVALEQIEGGTTVIVRVNPLQAADCRSYFAQSMEARNLPEVVDDQAIARDHCVVETTLGHTEIGVEVQLKEIELGLTDLMTRLPRTAGAGEE